MTDPAHWIDDWADETDSSVAVMEPRSTFDPCILGVVEVGDDVVVLYDREAVIGAMRADMNLDRDDAIDWYEFNMARSNLWAFALAMGDRNADRQ